MVFNTSQCCCCNNIFGYKWLIFGIYFQCEFCGWRDAIVSVWRKFSDQCWHLLRTLSIFLYTLFFLILYNDDNVWAIHQKWLYCLWNQWLWECYTYENKWPCLLGHLNKVVSFFFWLDDKYVFFGMKWNEIYNIIYAHFQWTLITWFKHYRKRPYTAKQSNILWFSCCSLKLFDYGLNKAIHCGLVVPCCSYSITE